MTVTKESQSARILKLLKSKGPKGNVTNSELNKICYRYSARIYELRNEGHNIQGACVTNGLHVYWLIPEPSERAD